MAATIARRVRWGFLGCGRITHDFVNAVNVLPDVELVACAARQLGAAQEFSKTFNIPTAYGSYQELVADERIEVIYIGTLHPQHAEHAILALNAGKNVVIEKPAAVNYKQGAAIDAAARKNNKFVMEAMWTRFIPAVVKVRALIAEGLIGAPNTVNATFGIRMPSAEEVPRLWENQHAGGAVLDLGVYAIAMANMVFGNGSQNYPSKIVATGELDSVHKVDIQESISLQYGAGQQAFINLSFLGQSTNEVIIAGSKGYIRIHGTFNCSQRISHRVNGAAEETVLEFLEPKTAEQREFLFTDSQLMHYEASEINESIRTGAVQSKIYSFAESLNILKIMDEVRRQVGVVYACDSE